MCRRCPSDPQERKRWGCDEPAAVVIEDMIADDDGREYHYYQCPSKFIPASVWQFLREYDYVEKFKHTAKPFKDVSVRFLNMAAYLESHIGEYRELIQREKGGLRGA